MWVLTLLAGLQFSMTASASAQETDSNWSAASVDESFAALQQALSAKANDLLASAQRPLPAAQPHPEPLGISALPSGPDTSATQAESNSHLRNALQRMQALRPSLEPILRQEGIPAQMAAVVLVESSARTTAVSPQGARGLWQIMPDTARRYGLVVSEAVDERLDPYKSTRAAARYLRDLYRQFGNWPLALAAYNAGGDLVERAIDRASSRDFNSIARAGVLPLETRSYVPAVLRAIGILQGTSGRVLSTLCPETDRC